MATKKVKSEKEKQEERLKKQQETIVKIKQNYVSWEKSIVEQLQMSSPNHHVTTGGFREEVWMSLFQNMIPQKFSIARSVFIIDSAGRISDEVDLAIFDEQYSPYIFRQGIIKYIPIEAVAVAIQCKSTDLRGIEDWATTILDLKTSLEGISRTMQGLVYAETKPDTSLIQTSTRPIMILCHLKKKPSEKYQKNFEKFDFVLSLSKEDRLEVKLAGQNEETSTIGYWLKELNQKDDPKYNNKHQSISKENEYSFDMGTYRVYRDAKPESEEISLLTLNFQLNQLLMLINNPLLFPHRAYVDMFNHHPY